MKCLLLRRKDWAESPSASPDSDAQPPSRHPRRKGRQSVRSIVHAMTHHTREVEVPSSDRTGKQSRENSNHNLNAKRRRPLTKVNPLRSPDWLRRCAEMIQRELDRANPRKNPEIGRNLRFFAVSPLFRPLPLRFCKSPFGPSGDDAHTNARALTHGARLTEHSVRHSLVGEPHVRVSRASPANANARDRPPSSGRF